MWGRETAAKGREGVDQRSEKGWHRFALAVGIVFFGMCVRTFYKRDGIPSARLDETALVTLSLRSDWWVLSDPISDWSDPSDSVPESAEVVACEVVIDQKEQNFVW